MLLTGDSRGVTVRATSKLNLFLEITGKRADGYHELESVFHEIDLGDNLTFEPAPALSLEVRGDGAPAGEDNIVMKAARLVASEIKTSAGARIILEKRVPSGAGLGGGSADAAATLLALDRLWNLSLPLPSLHALAARLGSDVNFFLEGRTALCTGRGEIVAPLPPHPPLHFLLLAPPFPTLTADVYRLFTFDLKAPRRVPTLLLSRLPAGEPTALEGGLFNRLEPAALAAEPRLVRVLAAAQRIGPSGARVTGSGSTVYMPVSSRTAAEKLATDPELSSLGRLIPASSAR
ncbi:MAG: 4-(cytidine 5'-diphospho)-2-C-methyl-D-erythritol kinase [Planctomycetes bacterium]|nr:4-(cytidine 5'-diphospho)-2-C-methyl-D-erythritol kinase [Planctomycetota bacterium]